MEQEKLTAKTSFRNTKADTSQWCEQNFLQWFSGLLKFKKSNLDQDLIEPIELHLALAQEREQTGKIFIDEVELALQQDQLRRYKQEFDKNKFK
ncbi:hypothetical protein [Vibrio rumoiensis]|uniref:hypothetical protein n=1 Tax=Vibrio rumoiensis TaxID=76258 RepID=UPI003AA836FD